MSLVRDRLSFADLRLAARFLRRVPGHLRRPLTVAHAATIVQERRARREADFLELVTRTVYADPDSPYRRLLDLAGCERGDLEQLVRAEGVEGALHVLFRQGVYLTVDEFKGRRAARRGSATIEIDAARLRNPLSAMHMPTQSGGSGGNASPLVYDLASIRDHAANTLLALDAQGGRDWVKAVWGVSTGSAPVVLRFGSFGSPVARWFVHVSPVAPGIHPRYRWIPEGLRLAAATAGVRFPRPEVVSLADPLALARWMIETRRAGRTPHLYGFASPMVRLCETALAAGLDLTGARFTVTGEPVTAARLAAIRAAGAEVALDYGCAEAGGPVSYGCLRPSAADDVHFCDDLHALIQPEPDTPHPEVPARAVLLSSLRTSAPVILLNVSLGDRAHVTRRAVRVPARGPRLGHAPRHDPQLREAHRRRHDVPRRRRRRRAGSRISRPASAAGPRTTSSSRRSAPTANRTLCCASTRASARSTREGCAHALLDAIGAGSGAERRHGHVLARRRPAARRAEAAPRVGEGQAPARVAISDAGGGRCSGHA